jgi:hypothetical protein
MDRTKVVILIIYLRGVSLCNSSLEPRRRALNGGEDKK